MEGLAELVCSNSLRSDGITNGSGLLKAELRLLGSRVIAAADETQVPAGGALAVDRHAFSAEITRAIEDHPLIELKRGEVTQIPDDGIVIIATGPLTSDALAAEVGKLVGGDLLYFHDAIAPIVEGDSIDMSKAWRASRYDKGSADYINCPLSQEQYYELIDDLLSAEKVTLREFESLKPFEGCMPIEVMAERGRETLSFGPMKPVGLVDPHTGRLPYAVLQLRQENSEATLYNLVGFQTRMKWGEQKRVFKKFPALSRRCLRALAACTATPLSRRLRCFTLRCSSKQIRAFSSPGRSPALKATLSQSPWAGGPEFKRLAACRANPRPPLPLQP